MGSPRHRLCTTGAVVLAVGFIVSGCSQADQDQIGRIAQPPPSSDIAEIVTPIWQGAWIASAVVGVFVWGLIAWAVLRYRRRSDNEVPAQVRYNLPIEVLYTIAPIVVVLGFFYWAEVSQHDIQNRPDPTVNIQVVGQKWAWTFNYLDDPALGGSTDVYDPGTPDDTADLYLPVGETVNFTLNSPDVVHSFWVPEFYFKMDVIPGKTNSFAMTSTREGTFRGRCAELCGIYHSRMLFDVHVVSQADYAQHLQDLRDAGQVGAPDGADYARTQEGLDVEGAQ